MSTIESESETETAPRSATGLDSNVAGALTYVLGFVTGAIFLLVERDDAFVRWHAAQSVVAFGGLLALNVGLSLVSLFVAVAVGGVVGSAVGALLGLLGLLLALGTVVAWAGLMATAFQGRTVRIPVAAGVADGIVG
jgi:uncharacterized membrane protein